MHDDHRHLRGEDITSLNYKELMALEEALENGLTGVREKQVSFNFLISYYYFFKYQIIYI